MTGPAIDTDILIIGAGASGAVAARYLASHGLAVTCLEQGEWPDEAKYVGRRAERELVAYPRWHPNPNVRLAEADYPVDVSECDVAPMMYNGVGGSTILWGALWHRLAPSDFKVRSLDGVASDWPLSYDDLVADYDQVEADLGVSGLGGDPAYPVHGDYPTPAFPLSPVAVAFAEAMNRKGWHWWPGCNAIASRPWKNLNACVRRAACPTGCADGAKASTNITHWPDAIADGAQLVTGARVRQITIDAAGRANGAVFLDRSGEEHRARAKIVILCANGIGTPRLLLLSTCSRFPNGLANGSDLVGRGLMMHPTGVASGVLDAPAETWLGPYGQVASSMEFYETDARRDFIRGSKWTLAQSSGPLSLALGLGSSGTELQDQLMRRLGRTFDLLTFAEDLPEVDNRVTLDQELTDSDGLPAPKIHYRVGENTLRILRHSLERAREVLVDMGAHDIRISTIVPEYGGAHLMGTARMGQDRSDSVVDEWGEAHEVPNLYVFDGSVFPTGGAVNPTATICALARRFSRRLVDVRRTVSVAA
jgi:choline dehydrogenase-like flavoprotein